MEDLEHNLKTKEEMEVVHLSTLFWLLVTGVLCGIVITCYKLGIHYLSKGMTTLLKVCQGSWIASLGFVLLFVGLATVVYFMDQQDAHVKGSGIPVIYGLIEHKWSVNWRKVLPLKFLTSLLTVGSGLTLGREGPSVQMGGLVGQAVHEITGRKEEQKYFVGASAGAGLAVAFNAPLAGMLFAVEEIYKRTNRRVFLSSSLTVFAAIFCSDLWMGNRPALINIPNFQVTSLAQYGYLVVLGLLAGLSGVLFNVVIVDGKEFYGRLPFNNYLKFVFPFVVTALFLLMDGELFGAGESIILMPLQGNPSWMRLVYFYGVKLLLLFLAFGAGTPGGSLVPLLVIGSLMGNIYGSILCNLGFIAPEMVLIFSLLGMCGHFAAIVRSPITAVVLIVEMTGGAFHYYLALALVSLLAYTLSEAIGSKPFYDDLYERMLAKQKKKE